MEKINRHILCIDLKSFFASVECIDRGLNPFQVPLVVANKKQGNGAITLAVTPFLKEKGIPGRIRLYEIPKNIKYEIVSPRMSRYIEVSKQVVHIYLDFISSEDLHIYSIDECFLDVTDYLSYYKTDDLTLAKRILQTIKEKTGLTATCGIGPNMLLAKISMDIEAKHNQDFLSKWNYDDVFTKLWPITPLSKVWGIGSKMEKKLNRLGIYNVYDLAHMDQNILKKQFGVIGEELWEHANGIDNAIIHNFEKEKEEKSIGHSQVLLRDYYEEEIYLIIKEMLDVLTTRLRVLKKETNLISLGIHYSKEAAGGFYHSRKLSNPTDLTEELYPICEMIFQNFYEENTPIRKVSITFGKLTSKLGKQLNLFESLEKQQQQEKMARAMDDIQQKFGKTSLLRATSLLSYSNVKEESKKIGGHYA